MYLYILKVVNEFEDKNTGKTHLKNDTIKVDEERALELFSSDYHVVKFLGKELLSSKETNDVAKETDDAAKETNDAAKETDDAAKETNDAAKETDDATKEIEKDNQLENDYNDNLDSLNYKELLKIAKDNNLDITGASNKEKLKDLIRKSQK